jgi:hypothetical protein
LAADSESVAIAGFAPLWTPVPGRGTRLDMTRLDIARGQIPRAVFSIIGVSVP